jgi:hypothetical protein
MAYLIERLNIFAKGLPDITITYIFEDLINGLSTRSVQIDPFYEGQLERARDQVIYDFVDEFYGNANPALVPAQVNLILRAPVNTRRVTYAIFEEGIKEIELLSIRDYIVDQSVRRSRYSKQVVALSGEIMAQAIAISRDSILYRLWLNFLPFAFESNSAFLLLDSIFTYSNRETCLFAIRKIEASSGYPEFFDGGHFIRYIQFIENILPTQNNSEVIASLQKLLAHLKKRQQEYEAI